MTRNFLISISGILSVSAAYCQTNRNNLQKPNIIILLVDDLGCKDVGFMGSSYYETPNLDKLANQGLIFTNAYASCAVSSPTRVSIQTGRYPVRSGITDWIRARFQLENGEYSTSLYDENPGKSLRTPSNPYWMELNEITIAEILKTRGYFSCHIGKWHLGPDEYYPEKQGYDINIAGNDMGQPVNYFDPYINAKGVGFPNLQSRKTGEYLEDRLADELIRVIENNKDKPFFINMCYYSVHRPLMAKPELIEKYKMKNATDGQNNPVYAAMIENLDQAVGTMINTLEKNNLLENTIIFFMSDNGGLIEVTDNSPFRAGKGYPYEGGIKVPMFIYWKNKINPGQFCNQLVSTLDILPTICAITGSPLPETEIDGQNISPVFTGNKLRDKPLFWHFPHYWGKVVTPYSIIRDKEWKLIKWYEDAEYELFNLNKDMKESYNFSESYPAKVKKLDKKLQKWLRRTDAKLPEKK